MSASTPEDKASQQVEKLCSLSIHDENTSREDVLLDLALFAHDTVKPGDLVEVTALSTTATVQDPASFTAAPRVGFGAKSRRAGKEHLTAPLSDGTAAEEERTDLQAHVSDIPGLRGQGRRDADHHKRYVFVVKAISPELKQKHHNLQVSRSRPRSRGLSTACVVQSMLTRSALRSLCLLT